MTSHLQQFRDLIEAKSKDTHAESKTDFEQNTLSFLVDCIDQAIKDLDKCNVLASGSTYLIDATKAVAQLLDSVERATVQRDISLLEDHVLETCFFDKPRGPQHSPHVQFVTDRNIRLAFEGILAARDLTEVISKTAVGSPRDAAEKVTTAIDTFVERCQSAFTDGPQILSEKRPDGKWSVRARYQSTLRPHVS